MTELNRLMKELRRRSFQKYRGREKASFWREKDYLNGEVEAGVVILPTIGCRWGRSSGCTMCGYVYDSAREITQEEILNQFTAALEKLQGVEYLKIFTSGSFLDEQELTRETAKKILAMLNEKRHIARVQIESRPEFIDARRLKELKRDFIPELEIGIGLETASDEIRASCINKGYTLEDFKSTVAACKSQNVLVKAYLLIKPPFLTEAEAIQDAISSGIEAAKLGVGRLSYNPVNIQRGTLVEELWKRGEYRTPWLWSVVEILRSVKKRVSIPVLSHPIAAGRERGAHNCGSCDDAVYEGIIKFSSTQDLSFLENLSCECRKRWEAQLELEQFSH